MSGLFGNSQNTGGGLFGGQKTTSGGLFGGNDIYFWFNTILYKLLLFQLKKSMHILSF